LNPAEIKALLRRWALPVGVLTVIGAVVAYAVTTTMRPMYRAQGTLLVLAAAPALNANLGLQSNQIIQTDASLMTLPPLLDRVSTDLNLGVSGAELAKAITAVPEKDTQLIDVLVTDANPDRAARIANTLMKDFVDDLTGQNQSLIREQSSSLNALISQLQSRVQTDQEELQAAQRAKQDTSALSAQLAADSAILAALTANYNSTAAQQVQGINSVRVASQATPPLLPAWPNKSMNIALGGFAGLLVGITVAVLFEYLDQGLRNEEDVRRKLGLPTLGVIPRFRPGAQHNGPRNHRAALMAGEAYRRLRTNLLFSTIDTPLSSVLITSTSLAEGKTRTAANLAGVVAASGQRVLLIDADLHRPSQHRLFGRPLRDGISDFLLAASRSEDLVLNGQHRTEHPNLALLTAGTIPPNPSELLASRQFPGVLRNLERHYDLVVIDTPPVTAVTDALSIAAHA
jgi:capsular exopolysaccharide synthesis family protein